MQKHLFLGVEAIGQGSIDGGMSGVYAYPGTPSTEITEFIQENEFNGMASFQPFGGHSQCESPPVQCL